MQAHIKEANGIKSGESNSSVSIIIQIKTIFFFTMTDNITSQNTDISSWITLYPICLHCIQPTTSLFLPYNRTSLHPLAIHSLADTYLRYVPCWLPSVTPYGYTAVTFRVVFHATCPARGKSSIGCGSSYSLYIYSYIPLHLVQQSFLLS
jgi:hypothetical protein